MQSVKIETRVREALGDDWLPDLYANEIRTQRTRACRIDVREDENRVEIQHTLLGIELKVGRHRIACPDLSAARYMRVFARLGCRDLAIPYDITRISSAADMLESSWQRTLLVLGQETSDRSKRGVTAIRKRLVRQIREELAEIGAGEPMPAFDRSTRRKRD